jgi:hypothetical protein
VNPAKAFTSLHFIEIYFEGESQFVSFRNENFLLSGIRLATLQ